MFKKALVILTLSSVVAVPNLAATAQGAALPLQGKTTPYVTSDIQKDWKKKDAPTSKNKAFGEEIWVMLGSPIPSGWVVVRSSGNMNLIKNLNNAPSGYE
ncbi:hypothetical protein ABES16_32070, partial [Brevibacillus brevis]